MADSINLKFPQDFFKDYARGKPCKIRIARECGYQCSHDETVVLCHITLPGLKAMGKKLVPDLCGAWGCSVCHELVDGRRKPTPDAPLYYHWPKEFTKPWLENMHLQGMARTLDQLVADGVLPNP